ncbi:hypothetical protein EDB80DRAFT_894358 [Ilyonectria destructans]|nr:hypothetical protein EDB80DRAFT_894358 [Ilyonectria destructans]
MANPPRPTPPSSSNRGNYFPRSQAHLSQPTPSRTIARPDDLSDQEKFQLKDLMEEWIMSRSVMDLNTVTVPDVLFRSFLIKIFELWNSNITGNPLPSIPERTAKETSIMVGTLRESHPPSKKRKHGQESPEIQTSRLARAPIYLAPTLQYGEENVPWMWKQAKINPMNHYDACERLRVKNDSRANPRVHSDDCAAGFVELELIQDVVHGMWDDVEAMKNEVESTRSNETGYVL